MVNIIACQKSQVAICLLDEEKVRRLLIPLKVLAGPHFGDETILYAELDKSELTHSKMNFDVTGHYSRPDIFRLQIDQSKKPTVEFEQRNDGFQPSIGRDQNHYLNGIRTFDSSPTSVTSTFTV